jgi:hypothetical protein
MIPVEAEAVDPLLVGIGIQEEVPLDPWLVDHQWAPAGPPIAEGARVVGDEPLPGREVLQLIRPGEEEPGPGHVATVVVAAEPGKIEPPAPEQPAGTGPLMPKHQMGVDLVAPELETEVVHLEVGVHHPQRRVEHPVALLFVERDPSGIAGERRRA